MKTKERGKYKKHLPSFQVGLVRRLRCIFKGRSLKEFYHWTGIRPDSVLKCLNYKSKPTVKLLLGVCEHYDQSADFLLGLKTLSEIEKERATVQQVSFQCELVKRLEDRVKKLEMENEALKAIIAHTQEVLAEE